MQRLVIGSLLGAVFMFFIGYLAYGTPLMGIGYKSAGLQQQLAIQSAMKGLPTGTYAIPDGHSPEGAAAYGAGPVAVVQLNSSGFAPNEPMVFAAGFIHMAIAAFMLGLVLWAIRDRVTDIGSRMQVVVWTSVVAVFFTRFGEPIWFHSDWINALYVALVEALSLVGAGFILARWFVPAAKRTAARAA